MLHKSRTLTVKTPGRAFVRIGAELQLAVADMDVGQGLLNAFVAHTSASLCIQENTDPDVLRDLMDALDRLAPEDHGYRHSLEGRDDMPAHIRSMLTATQLLLPVRDGRIALGTWQEVYLIEHRRAPHQRRIEVDFLGS